MNDETPVEYNARLRQLSNFLTYRVSRLQAKLNAQASRILRNSVGLTLNQWRMIAFIGGAEQITASELISVTAMDKGLVSRNVSALINDGLVTSSTRDTDNRVHVLRLTAKGSDIFDIALPLMRRRQAHLQKNLSQADIETFRRVITVLEHAAEETDI